MAHFQENISTPAEEKEGDPLHNLSASEELRDLSTNEQSRDPIMAPANKPLRDPVESRPYQDEGVAEFLKLGVKPHIAVYDLDTAGITVENYRTNPHPAAQAFARYIYNTKMSWAAIRRAGGSAPLETIDELVAQANRPTAKLIELTGQNEAEEEKKLKSSDVLSYALINIEDRRLLGIFNPHNLYFPDGYLTGLVLEKTIEVFGDRDIWTKVVVEPKEYAYTRSRELIMSHGFEQEPGKYETLGGIVIPAVPGIRDEPETVTLISDWHVHRPGALTQDAELRLNDLNDSMRQMAQNIAPAARFPSAHAHIGVWTRGDEKDLPYYIAEQQSQNAVYVQSINPRKRYLHRNNLSYIKRRTRFPEGGMNGVMIMDGVLDDIESQGGNIPRFLNAQVRSLKIDGMLIIKGEITPERDRKYYLDLARRVLDCRMLEYAPVHKYGKELFEIYLQRVSENDSVAIKKISSRKIDNPSYLTRTFYRNKETGAHREIVGRESDSVIDLVVYSEDEGEHLMLRKRFYPRGIPQAMINVTGSNGTARDYHLKGHIRSGHEDEPIALIQRNGESYEEVVIRGLMQRTGLSRDDIISISEPGEIIFTDPARYSETRQVARVKIRPNRLGKKIEKSYSGLSNSGRVEPRPVKDVLMGYSTSPAETASAYQLALDLGIEIPMWPTGQKKLEDQSAEDTLTPIPAAELFAMQNATDELLWERVETAPEEELFNQVFEDEFAEVGHDGKLMPNDEDPKTVSLQYVTTREELGLTNNRLPVCICYRSGDSYKIGFQISDDKPHAEEVLKQNKLVDGYGFYVPNTVKPESYKARKAFVSDAIEDETALKVRTVRELGQDLYVSAGLTPTRIFPMLVEVDATSAAASGIPFCDAEELKDNISNIRALSTRVTVLRALHALGVLNKGTTGE